MKFENVVITPHTAGHGPYLDDRRLEELRALRLQSVDMGLAADRLVLVNLDTDLRLNKPQLDITIDGQPFTLRPGSQATGDASGAQDDRRDACHIEHCRFEANAR